MYFHPKRPHSLIKHEYELIITTDSSFGPKNHTVYLKEPFHVVCPFHLPLQFGQNCENEEVK